MLLKILQNSQENICAKASFLIKFRPEACSIIRKENLAQVFSWEFCETFKNTYFEEYFQPAVSVCMSEAYLKPCQAFTLELLSQDS